MASRNSSYTPAPRHSTSAGAVSPQRQPTLRRSLERAYGLIKQFSTDPNRVLIQLSTHLPLEAGMLWSGNSASGKPAAVFPAEPRGCAESHRQEFQRAICQAADTGAPAFTRLPCPQAGYHEMFIAPVLTAHGPAVTVSGALGLLLSSEKTFAQGDLVLAVLAAAHLGRAQRGESSGKASARQADLRGRLLTEVIAAAENERKRIAADLHDDTLQTMGMQLVKVQIVQRLLERGELNESRRELEALASSIQENTDRLRSIMSELRPSTLRDYGLLATIDDLIQRFRAQTGIPVTFVSRLGRRLPDDHETMVYRIVQEALNNIRKHAHAKKASISLEGLGDWYTLTVEDDGLGFEPQEAMERSLNTGHFGLITMRERADLIGGSFAIESGNSAGTRLRFQLPRLS